MTTDPSAPLPEERDEDIYRLHRQADFEEPQPRPENRAKDSGSTSVGVE